MTQPITCPLCRHQDFIGNHDLQSGVHKGFTVGRGKVLYFEMIWHSSGACTVYPIDKDRWPRYLTGDETITIHFHDKP